MSVFRRMADMRIFQSSLPLRSDMVDFNMHG